MYINYSTSSGLKTASAQIYAGPCALVGIDVTAPDTGFVTITVYDSENSTTTGKTILSEAIVDAGLQSLVHEYFVPVGCVKGIYVDLTLTGTGTPKFIIRYTPG